jgi:hypothetical protein
MCFILDRWKKISCPKKVWYLNVKHHFVHTRFYMDANILWYIYKIKSRIWFGWVNFNFNLEDRCFVDRCLSFCLFSFGHCVVCPSSIYGLWLPLWFLQALLTISSTSLRSRKPKGLNRIAKIGLGHTCLNTCDHCQIWPIIKRYLGASKP